MLARTSQPCAVAENPVLVQKKTQGERGFYPCSASPPPPPLSVATPPTAATKASRCTLNIPQQRPSESQLRQTAALFLLNAFSSTRCRVFKSFLFHVHLRRARSREPSPSSLRTRAETPALPLKLHTATALSAEARADSRTPTASSKQRRSKPCNQQQLSSCGGGVKNRFDSVVSFWWRTGAETRWPDSDSQQRFGRG